MRSTTAKYFFIFFFPLYLLFGQRERMRFDKLSTEQGIFQNSVVSICQDQIGFLWFGTYDGLVRYDGYYFKYFRHSYNDSTTLSQNYVRYLLKDQAGYLWVSTEHGLNRYNHTTENFTTYHSDPNNPNSLTDNRLRKMCETKNGDLWICSVNGLTKLDRDRKKFTRYFHDPNNPNTISGNLVRAVTEDENGNLWIGTNGGLDMLNTATETFTHYRYDKNNKESISSNVITSLLQDRNGMIWVATLSDGVNRFDPKKKTFRSYKFNPADSKSIRNNLIMHILEDRSGMLWIATYGGGLERYNPINDGFIHYQNVFGDPTSISSNKVYCLFEDRSGIIYIGTDFSGINKIDPEKKQFAWYNYNREDPKSLLNNNVSCFYENSDDNGKTIWIGTRGGGLGLFDREKEEFTYYRSDLNNQNSLVNDDIRCITKDSSGFLWIGTSNGISRFDWKKKKFFRYLYETNNHRGLSHYMVFNILVDKSNTVWIATYGGGLEKYDRENDRFIHYQIDPNDSNCINDNYLWCIIEDRPGNLWIGTNTGGLNYFNKKNEKFISYTNIQNNPNSLSENKVLCVYEDRNGTIWVGTGGGGLNEFDPVKKIFKRYVINDGLASNSVHFITQDSSNTLWISTNNGISRFDIKTHTFHNYTEYDGLQSNEFHVNSGCKSITGELFFGGINGFNIFRPEFVRENTNIPSIVFTDIQLFNKSIPIGISVENRTILDHSISETKSIELTYQDEVISFEFSSLDYSAPNKNMYSYIMEGFEDDWNNVGNRHFATYKKIPPGNYTFRVIGSNNSGVWNKQGASVEIKISPPFWETLWFRAVLIISLFSTLIAGYKIRTARIRAYNRELEKRVSERTSQLEIANKELEAFSYSVSHDLRAPLRAIDGYTRIFLEEFGKQIEDEGKQLLEVISNNSKKMGILIDELLALSRLGRSEMKLVRINMKELVESVFYDITTPESRARFDFRLANLPPSMGDFTLIRQVWTNLISNAIKFSSKKEKTCIEIDSYSNDKEITYVIKDNGAGFNMEYSKKLFGIFQRLHGVQDFEGTGVGLAIVHRLITRHGGRIWAEGEVNKGAAFYFTLPRN